MTNPITSPIRRNFLRLLATTAALWASGGRAQAPANAPAQLRIGYQKSAANLVIIKQLGWLAQRLPGTKVGWIEFPAGPQLLEALNAGAIDFGNTGEAPPIFAQAAGAPLRYVGYEPAAPTGEAILVPKDSPLKSVADLKGKTVALNKGSNVQYFLVKLLEKNGLKYGDVQSVFLAPADARAAFEKGAVDAWIIWDPFLAAAQKTLDARLLADAKGVVNNRAYYFTSRDFATRHAEIHCSMVLISSIAMRSTSAWRV
eukprot:gene51034-62414_t